MSTWKAFCPFCFSRIESDLGEWWCQGCFTHIPEPVNGNPFGTWFRKTPSRIWLWATYRLLQPIVKWCEDNFIIVFFLLSVGLPLALAQIIFTLMEGW